MECSVARLHGQYPTEMFELKAILDRGVDVCYWAK